MTNAIAINMSGYVRIATIRWWRKNKLYQLVWEIFNMETHVLRST